MKGGVLWFSWITKGFTCGIIINGTILEKTSTGDIIEEVKVDVEVSTRYKIISWDCRFVGKKRTFDKYAGMPMVFYIDNCLGEAGVDKTFGHMMYL